MADTFAATDFSRAWEQAVRGKLYSSCWGSLYLNTQILSPVDRDRLNSFYMINHEVHNRGEAPLLDRKD